MQTREAIHPLFAFEDPARDPVWVSINDYVMGGLSTSAYQPTGHGTALFRGALSLANNGGFATIRSPAADLGLGGFEGVELRVRGDGRSYRVGAWPAGGRSMTGSWRREFATVPGEWIVLRIPFRELIRTVRGRVMPGSGPLPPERIRSFAFSIADRNETPFQLELDWIRAYR